MELIASKTGRGAFALRSDGGRYSISIENGPEIPFSDAAEAYDYCVDHYAALQGTMRGYSYLNAAFELEDLK